MNEKAGPKRDRKRAEAEARQAAYDSLTTREKFNRAVERGHYNTPEATRLLERMVKEEKVVRGTMNIIT